MQITVHRAQELARVRRAIAGSTYNLARVLQQRSSHGVAFVPIRSMQVLAVLGADEFVFVDGMQRAWAMLAWDRFGSAERDSLSQPVAFDCVAYTPQATLAMQRLPRELHLALLGLAARRPQAGPAQVLGFRPAPR